MRFAMGLLLVVLACGGSSTSPDRIEPQDLIGTWTLLLDDSGCVPDYDGDVTAYFPIDEDDATRLQEDGTLMVVANKWSFNRDLSDPEDGITGTIYLEERRFTLNLFHGFPLRWDFDGNLVSANRMEGSFRDDWAHSGVCLGSAVATR